MRSRYLLLGARLKLVHISCPNEHLPSSFRLAILFLSSHPLPPRGRYVMSGLEKEHLLFLLPLNLSKEVCNSYLSVELKTIDPPLHCRFAPDSNFSVRTCTVQILSIIRDDPFGHKGKECPSSRTSAPHSEWHLSKRPFLPRKEEIARRRKRCRFNATPMTTQSISMNVGKRISPGNLARFDAFERRKVFSQMFYISKFFQLSWKHRYYIQSGGSGTFDRDKIEARLKERSVLPRRNRSFGKKKGRFSWNLDLLSLRFESELWRDPLRDKFFVCPRAPIFIFYLCGAGGWAGSYGSGRSLLRNLSFHFFLIR